MKNLSRSLLAVALMGLPLHAQDPTPPVEVTGEDELVETTSRFEMTWVHPDADFGRYRKLFLWQPVFEFRDIEEAGRSSTTHSVLLGQRGPFGIADESRQRFAEVVEEAFARELERGKLFEVVDTVGPDTLLVRGAVLDIVSQVPPDHPGRTRIYLSAVGEATFVFDLIDAATGVIQARVSSRRRIQPFGTGQIDALTPPTNSATVWLDVTRWARSAARDLIRELERAHKAAARDRPPMEGAGVSPPQP